ncbi:kinase-like domain-containing protein [Leptodontidium sp. MPI-SDFR-AT-0119]|nr:kinase-like domain-containing protein [Leptodontidium sp. MPI-SDFR-AT-0119]
MEDSNLIARLFPADGKGYKLALQAILMSENRSRYMPPQGETEPHCGSRESTASLEDEDDETASDTSAPGLQLTFNPGPKGGRGLEFGTHPNCDIRRLILRDFSKHGTIVKYDEKGGESRRTLVTKDDKGRELYHHFKWIIGSHKVPRDTKIIVIEIQGIGFRIDQATANEELPLGRFSIQSLPPTVAPSGAQTPNQGAIRLKQETLGKGAFAVDHVVKLIEWTTEPSPQLVLEYVPCGSLEGLSLTIEESMMVLYQGLSALHDLHGRKDPIVHRDIKPANILLQCRDPLYIKLTDFGLSRAQVDLTTICGTPIYLAPEVWRGKKYTPVVDIWSLGIVAFECAYDLPDYDEYRGKGWCELLIDQVNDWDNDELISLLSNYMIVMDPKSRGSAWYCYKEVSRLLVDSQERSLTPIPVSYVKGYNMADPDHSANPSLRSNIRYRSDAPSPHSRASSIVDPGSDLQGEESVPGIDLFGQHWLQDPNCVGSTVAAMGKESDSELSGWESWPSATSVPRTIPQSVGKQNDDDLHQGQEHLAQNSYAIDTWHKHHAHQSEISPSQNESVISTRPQERVETVWTSEEYVAARLLQGMHDEGWI